MSSTQHIYMYILCPADGYGWVSMIIIDRKIPEFYYHISTITNDNLFFPFVIITNRNRHQPG